jgi:aspartate ammonia-lyase
MKSGALATRCERCINGITANAERCRRDARNNVSILILASFAYIPLLSTHKPRVGS